MFFPGMKTALEGLGEDVTAIASLNPDYAALEMQRRQKHLQSWLSQTCPAGIDKEVWDEALPALAGLGYNSQDYQLTNPVFFDRLPIAAARNLPTEWSPFSVKEKRKGVRNFYWEAQQSNQVIIVDAIAVECPNQSFVTDVVNDELRITRSVPASGDHNRNQTKWATWMSMVDAGVFTLKDGKIPLYEDQPLGSCWSGQIGASVKVGTVSVATTTTRGLAATNVNEIATRDYERGMLDVRVGPGKLNRLPHPVLLSPGRAMSLEIEWPWVAGNNAPVYTDTVAPPTFAFEVQLICRRFTTGGRAKN